MKKVFLFGISILFLTVAVLSCDTSNAGDNEDLSSKIASINKKYQGNQPSEAKIDKKKAGFMAVADIMSAAVSPCLFGYGTLWGGFIGSCGAAVLYNDMMHGRSTGNLYLVEPVVVKNPDAYFDKYSFAGKYHNDFMIAYCKTNGTKPVFVNNKPSDLIKTEMLNSTHFNQSLQTKQDFILTLNKFDNLFAMMNNNESTERMVEELNSLNPNSAAEKNYLMQVVNFTLASELTANGMFSYVTEIENAIKNSTQLSPNAKENLLYDMEILRYSYALWNANIQN